MLVVYNAKQQKRSVFTAGAKVPEAGINYFLNNILKNIFILKKCCIININFRNIITAVNLGATKTHLSGGKHGTKIQAIVKHIEKV